MLFGKDHFSNTRRFSVRAVYVPSVFRFCNHGALTVKYRTLHGNCDHLRTENAKDFPNKHIFYHSLSKNIKKKKKHCVVRTIGRFFSCVCVGMREKYHSSMMKLTGQTFFPTHNVRTYVRTRILPIWESKYIIHTRIVWLLLLFLQEPCGRGDVESWPSIIRP